jgi:[ribosomal protein S18]-alanine N-acetyltransferase
MTPTNDAPVVVRRLTPADVSLAAALEALDRAVFPTPNLAVHDELGRDFALLFAATRANEVVGYLLAWRVADELEIHDVATAPEARRRGVGRALVGAVLDVARAVPGLVTAVHLEVRRGNDAALRLYEQAGFAIVGERRGYYENGDDAILMRIDTAP